MSTLVAVVVHINPPGRVKEEEDVIGWRLVTSNNRSITFQQMEQDELEVMTVLSWSPGLEYNSSPEAEFLDSRHVHL